MAYDPGLAERLREIFQAYSDYSERNMFGGVCFMLSGHMTCGIVGETLMARVGPAQYDSALQQPHVRKMDFTGKPMKGMVYVDPEGIDDDDALAEWINRCESFVRSLPPKK